MTPKEIIRSVLTGNPNRELCMGMQIMLKTLIELMDEDFVSEIHLIESEDPIHQDKNPEYLRKLRNNFQKTLDDYRKRYINKDKPL